jgi:hypothetical protein
MARRSEPTPQRIDPPNVYTLPQAKAALGLSPKSEALSPEIKHGRLRASRRLGRYWFLGEYLIEWIRGGELRRQPPDEPGPAAADEQPARGPESRAMKAARRAVEKLTEDERRELLAWAAERAAAGAQWEARA